MKIIAFGHIGSDAGYWTFENGHWVHHEGWGVDKLVEVNLALSMLGQLAHLKTPGLADAASKGLGEFVQRELTTHLGEHAKGGTIVIVNVAR